MLGILNYLDLLKKLEDPQVSVLELIDLGLLKLGKCSKCRRNRVLTHCTNFKFDYAGRCPKCRKFAPLTKATFFKNTRLPFHNIMQVLFCWAKGLSQKQCADITGIDR